MITVLCPSRGRPSALFESLSSLGSLAADATQVEVLVALDKNDKEREKSVEALSHAADLIGVIGLVVADRRWGYASRHRYYNAMAGKAQGNWLVLWHDDARMKTQGWDAAIEAQSCDQLLYPRVNHGCDPFSFPVWPAAWSQAWGHVSLSPDTSGWLLGVHRLLSGGAEPRIIDAEVYHDRYDITGGHADMTYAEGRGHGAARQHGRSTEAAVARVLEDEPLLLADVRIVRSLEVRAAD